MQLRPAWHRDPGIRPPRSLERTVSVPAGGPAQPVHAICRCALPGPCPAPTRPREAVLAGDAAPGPAAPHRHVSPAHPPPLLRGASAVDTPDSSRLSARNVPCVSEWLCCTRCPSRLAVQSSRASCWCFVGGKAETRGPCRWWRERPCSRVPLDSCMALAMASAWDLYARVGITPCFRSAVSGVITSSTSLVALPAPPRRSP